MQGNEAQIEVDRSNPTPVVRLIGDAPNCVALQMTFNKLLAERPGVVFIDLSRCGMLSSLAIGHIVAFHKAAKLQNGQVKLAALSPQVLGSLKHVGLTSVLTIVQSVEQPTA